MDAPKPRRRWFSFSLRTMFVAVSLFCMWLGYELNWIRERRAFLRMNMQKDSLAVPAPWSIRVLGERGYFIVYVQTRYRKVISDETLDVETIRRLNDARRLFPEAAIDFTFY
jgi:hypothetical protein